MRPEEILKHTEHRPWPIPDSSWKIYQEWQDVIFLHYKVDIDALKNYVPAELSIDTFDGDAWISVVAFTTRNVKPRGLPSFSPLSDFHEINIRTYIKDGKRSGIYFLSLEAAKIISAELTKLITELPYIFTEINREKGLFSGKNKDYNSFFDVKYEVKEIKEKDKLDSWLMERYALFQDGREHIIVFEVLHQPWELRNLNLTSKMIKYPPFAGFFINEPDRLGYSPGVEVLVWGKEKWKSSIV
ncbi:hypothetical protein APR41_10425 [Salegentibacter salinarum]|uniref:DUF2071 domain-containing protein n=1 Tax=Salegentibacter salinarum TaxID=447422 RepID=A0A2N0TN76_9FLAO|nr:DUF2071 domain-containing protein [Salegentibacter salinarum]PKD16193.1 hypothetical protein APR41_10425 [Salegentibacter salinarum]SKB68072.1 hypothetical protein SAMN05660903_02019 [Salegentibacter salinarum]